MYVPKNAFDINFVTMPIIIITSQEWFVYWLNLKYLIGGARIHKNRKPANSSYVLLVEIKDV